MHCWRRLRRHRWLITQRNVYRRWISEHYTCRECGVTTLKFIPTGFR